MVLFPRLYKDAGQQYINFSRHFSLLSKHQLCGKPPGLVLRLIILSGPEFTIPFTFRVIQKTEHEHEGRDEDFGRTFRHLYSMEL